MMHFIRLKARMLLAAVSCFTACCNNLYADSMAPQLTGFMRSSDAWGDNGQTTAYYGFYSISADGDVDFKAVSPTGPDNAWANCGSVYADGRYYCYNVDGTSMNYTLSYYVFDADSWTSVRQNAFSYKYSDAGSEQSQKARLVPSALAYNPLTGVIYAVTHTFSNSEKGFLCEADPDSGELHSLGEIPFMKTASCDASGVMYGIGLDGNLYRISGAGDVAIIGHTGYYPTRDSEISTGSAIYFRNGKMYYSLFGFATERDRDYNINAVFGLLEIDTATGKSTLLGVYPRDEVFSSLVAPNAHPDAPDAISGLVFEPETPASLKAVVKFTLPSVTYAQKKLEGDVGFEISVGTSTPVKGSGAPGSVVSEAVNVSAGMQTVSVTVTANGHKSPVAHASYFFGADTPAAVSELTLAYDGNTGNAVLTWNTPRGENGGMLEEEKLRYKIERMPGKVIVARSAKGNSFSEPADFPFDSYRYVVTPYYADKPSETGRSATSNIVKMGSPLPMPYDETFSSPSSLNGYTLIDANGDGSGSGWDSPEWCYDETYYCAFYYGKQGKPADDWLITPALDFDSEYLYKLTFKYYAYYGYGSKFRVVVGNTPTVEGMDKEVLMKETVSDFYDQPGITETVIFAPRKGDRFIGFHHISETMEHLSIDDVHVERYLSANVPGAVNGLTAERKSDTEVVLEFTVPELTAGGKDLDGSPLKVQIERNAATVPVGELADVKPGEKVRWADTDAPTAVNVYSVAVYNSNGEGLKKEISIDLRRGSPVEVESVRASFINDKQILIEWDPSTSATDEEGRPVDVDAIRYLVYKPVRDADDNIEYKVIGRDLEECRFIDNEPQLGLPAEGQQPLFYYVAPVNGDDEGYACESNTLIFGDSRPLPWSETWPKQVTENGQWFRSQTMGATWYIRYKGYEPLTDGVDGSGVVTCEPNRDVAFGMGGFISPRLDLTGNESPELSFWMYHGPEYTDGIQLAIGVDVGDSRQNLIPGAVFDARSEEQGWKKHTVSLKDYTLYKAASVVFYGYVRPDNCIHIDNVSLTGDRFAKELSLTGIAGPKECRTDEVADFEVSVANTGTTASGNFRIDFTVDGKVAGGKEMAGIASGETSTALFSYVPDNGQAGKTLDIAFRITEATGSDTNPANNVMSAMLEVKQGNLPYVTSVEGSIDGESVALEWGMPDKCEFTETFTDNFEAYEPFAIDDIGQWVMHDGDGLYNHYLSNGAGGVIEWENSRETQAFIVFNVGEIIYPMPFAPISGSQFLASWPAAGGANDDWVISPELDGRAQLISFYARSMMEGSDAINVLVSKTGNNPSDFYKLNGATPIKLSAGWQLLHFALPEGSRYFAIQNVGDNGTGIMIDDIMYHGYPTTAFIPDGYNVYRDGKKLNDEPLTERKYTDFDIASGNSYRYSIAPVFGNREGRMSDYLLIEASGIGTTSVDSGIEIATAPGAIIVTGACGRRISVCAVDGRLVASVAAEATERIEVAPGVYIVNAGETTSKIVVR